MSDSSHEMNMQTNPSQAVASPVIAAVNKEGNDRKILSKQLEAWHHFFADYIINRFGSEAVLEYFDGMKKRASNTKIYIMTDIEDLQNHNSCVGVDDLKELPADSVIILAYRQDYNALEVMNELEKYNLKYLGMLKNWPPAKYYNLNRNAHDTLQEEWLKTDRQPYYNAGDFEVIFQALEQTKNLSGCYVEIGTFQGASARAAINFLNRVDPARKAFFCDTYEGFNYTEAANSPDSRWFNTHKETSINRVNDF